jgi:hypothetical protein
MITSWGRIVIASQKDSLQKISGIQQNVKLTSAITNTMVILAKIQKPRHNNIPAYFGLHLSVIRWMHKLIICEIHHPIANCDRTLVLLLAQPLMNSKHNPSSSKILIVCLNRMACID